MVGCLPGQYPGGQGARAGTAGAVGLPLADYEILARLEGVPEGERIRMQKLARKVLLSKSGLSQLFYQTRAARAGRASWGPR